MISIKRTVALDSVLTKDEWSKLIQSAEDGKDKIIVCLATLGLRASEISQVQREWVDYAQQTIHLFKHATKRNKGRVVPFGKFSVIKEVIVSFFMLEKEIGLSRVAIWQRVQRMASRAGITHPVTPHGLRATGATWLAMAGYSLTGLQDHFGWTQIQTAQHYVRKTGASAMRDMNEYGDKIL